MAFQCGHLEAQDVLVDCDDVHLLELEAKPIFRQKQHWLRRLMYRDITHRLAYMNPGLEPVKLRGQYDLLVVMCQTYWDFLNVNAIQNWKEHCKTSVCWIDELWAANLPLYKHWLPALKQFDHIVVGMQGTIGPLSDVLERRCHYLPGAVDALRFTPFPNPPARTIEVYSVGRRWDGIHRTLLRRAQDRGAFYIYDTLQTGESQTPSHQQHRDLYANVAKRSHFFTVAPGKVNVPEETMGQVEVGFRYYEGSAAGTVMIGQAPDCEHFRQMFDWADVVIPLKPDGSDTDAIVSELLSDAARTSAISRRNAQGALLHHDWVYRWKRVLAIAGLEPRPALQSRERLLRQLAEN